jgi:hypothetical protein
MPRKAKAMALFLTDETCSIRAVVRSRAAPAHHVERSGIIPHLADRRGASGSAAALGTDRPRVTRSPGGLPRGDAGRNQRLATFGKPAGHY